MKYRQLHTLKKKKNKNRTKTTIEEVSGREGKAWFM